MGDAPDRIWAQKTAVGWEEPIATIYRVPHFPEYVRADHITSLQKRIEVLEKALEQIALKNELAYDGCPTTAEDARAALQEE